MLETSMSTVQDTLNTLEVKVDGLEGKYGEFTVATKAPCKTKPTLSQESFEHSMMRY